MKQLIANTIREHLSTLSDEELIAHAMKWEVYVESPPAAPRLPTPARIKPAPVDKPRKEAIGQNPEIVWNVLNAAQRGLAMGDILAATGLTASSARTALKHLIDKGSVFTHGDRRFARYAISAELAEEASTAAQGGGDA